MDGPQTSNRLLRDLCVALATSRFRTPEYRESRAVSGGPTLAAELASRLEAPLQQELDARGMTLNLTLVRIIAERRSVRSPFADLAETLADRAYLEQFVADLADTGGSRHASARLELYVIARQCLERSSFWGQRTPAFYILLELAEQAGLNPDDLYNEFWDRRIWPHIVRGKHPLRHPWFLYKWVQDRAHGFAGKRIEALRKDLARTTLLEEERRETSEDTPAGTIRPGDPRIAPDVVPVDEAAISRIRLHGLIRWLATRFVELYDGQPLGLLIFLFRRVMMPNVSGINEIVSGKNQQIAIVLTYWKHDPDTLWHYLTNTYHGVGLDADVADLVVAAVSAGFAGIERAEITDAWVTNRLNRFETALKGAVRAHRDELERLLGAGRDAVAAKGGDDDQA